VQAQRLREALEEFHIEAAVERPPSAAPRTAPGGARRRATRQPPALPAPEMAGTRPARARDDAFEEF
jgi:hypothetical protein